MTGSVRFTREAQPCWMAILASIVGWWVLTADGLPTIAAESAVSFGRDVRPLLAAHCFPCHGPDEDAREADLRLDQRAAALDILGVDDPEESSFLTRILSDDDDLRMPPPDAQNPLRAEDKKLLRSWVQLGAPYEQHWAFVPPQRPAVPSVTTDWGENPIDAFLYQRMHAAGQHPSPPADRYTLVRRLYLDLLGLPPSPAEADAFVLDESPTAYEKLVDRLMASPRFGEHAGRYWLDLARYADTNGYEKDRPRSMWPYRDWVLDALNHDQPFDTFTIEQLAGDMLPQASRAQRIATGFHRNTMLNEEGGIDPLEYRFYAQVDRVATTGTVWLGMTLGCAQCHSHKYDPITHEDYYRFLALLNNADEPDLPLRTPAQQAEVDARLSQMFAELASEFPPDDALGSDTERRQRHLAKAEAAWIQEQQAALVDWQVAKPTSFSTNLPRLEALADHSLFASGDFTKRDEYVVEFELPATTAFTALRLEALPDDRLPAGGPGRAYYEGRKGDFFLSELSLEAEGSVVTFEGGSRSYGKIAVGSGDAKAANVFDGDGSTGWSTAHREGERHVLVLRFEQPMRAQRWKLKLLFERHFVAGLGRFRLSMTSAPGAQALDLPAHVESILATQRATWTNTEKRQVRRAFLRQTPLLKQARDSRKLAPERPAIAMVMAERPADNPRPTHRHHRGEWLSPREEVSPGLPAIFASKTAPANRLELARWLVSEKNPLTARVVVNRVWSQLMGLSLAGADGDFGTQAPPPTHPELLDWLACEFQKQQWSMKRLHRLIVTSAAYRQSSRRPAGETSAGHAWYARAHRQRVDGETVRDIMLSASGRLQSELKGPSVYPPQPAEVTALAYGGNQWKAAQDSGRFRRSLYTFRKRTAPFAAYTTFDGPSHEVCTASRPRSNTPLQALTLLNDAMYLELAQALAQWARENNPDSAEQIRFMFRRLLTRPPSADEVATLLHYYDRQHQRFASGELDVAIGGDQDPATAALTLVARVLMNLDETITKQ